MVDRMDEIKGHFIDGKLRVIDWPKPRAANPNLLREEFERFEREMADRATVTSKLRGEVK